MKPKTPNENVPNRNTQVTQPINKKAKGIAKKPAPITESVDFFVPPIDVTATTVDKVYPLDKILTAEQYDAIYDEMTKVDFEQEFSKGMREIYKNRQLTKEETVLALYASSLYKLRFKHGKTKRVKICYSSPTLNKYLIQNFIRISRNFEYSISFLLRKKAVAYAVTLYMLLNNYRLDFSEFSEEFQIPCIMPERYSAFTGATVEVLPNKIILVLRLPLHRRYVCQKQLL